MKRKGVRGTFEVSARVGLIVKCRGKNGKGFKGSIELVKAWSMTKNQWKKEEESGKHLLTRIQLYRLAVISLQDETDILFYSSQSLKAQSLIQTIHDSINAVLRRFNRTLPSKQQQPTPKPNLTICLIPLPKQTDNNC
jgi:hypothetical protein